MKYVRRPQMPACNFSSYFSMLDITSTYIDGVVLGDWKCANFSAKNKDTTVSYKTQ